MGIKINKISSEKIKKKLKEFKFPLLILVIGAMLVLLPMNQHSEKKEASGAQQQEVIPTEMKTVSYVEQTEQRLAEILSQISGAGMVKVMLTVRGSDITYFQTDSDTSSEQADESSSSSTQYKTVILSGNGEYDKAAVIKTEYPPFQGALIVSQGAEDAAIRLALVNAVSSLLGLGTDKISVVKMK